MPLGTDALNLSDSYLGLARQLNRLEVALAVFDEDPDAAERDRQTLAMRDQLRQAAKEVVQQLYLIGEEWGSDVAPFLDVLAHLESDRCAGACGMLDTAAQQAVGRIRARAEIEATRRNGQLRSAAAPPGGLNAEPEGRPAAAAGPPRVCRGSAAQQRLQSAYQEMGKVHCIHYSCGLFGASSAPAEVGHIVVKRLSDHTVETFDARQGGEAPALRRFDEYVRAHPDALWVNWNMRDQQFGFEAIARRQALLGVPATIVSAAARLDLKRVLHDIYGDDYIGHPRLPSLIRLNGITDRGLLNEQQAKAAFAAGNGEALLGSTLRKVEALAELFLRAAEGRLKTLLSEPKPAADPTPPRAPAQPSGKRRTARPRTKSDTSSLPLLVGKLKFVFDLVRKLPDGEGLSAKEIVKKLPDGEHVEESTLTRHIMPKLRPYGIVGRAGVGYHFDPAARRGNRRGNGADRR